MNQRLLASLGALILAAAAAAPASAALSTWSSLSGLGAPVPSWVRTFDASGPSVYAGSEGDGVFSSSNAGATWGPLGSLPTGSRNVRVVYSSSGDVYAGTDGGLYKSTGGGMFQPVAQGPEDDPAHPAKLNRSVQAVLASPTTPGTLLAGVFSGGVYKSGDGGQTWQPPAPGNGMAAAETVWSLTSHPALPNVVLAATGSGVYRSIDFGSTWTLTTDGLSTTTLRVLVDTTQPNPLLYYAATTSGVYRTVNAGVTWTPINAGMNGGQVRGLLLAGNKHLWAATENGLYASSTGNATTFTTPRWRKVTNAGLGSNTIFWAVSSFLGGSTLLAGTQSNGGYALTFQPPVNTAVPSIGGTLQVGKTLAATSGTWSGTPTIDYSHQWQRCTSTSAGTCSDIAGETDAQHVLVNADLGKYLRVQVSAENDFPLSGSLPKASSAIAGPVVANPGTLPGANQLSAASIMTNPPGDPSLPKVGDTLHAQNWFFNPAATSTSFRWLRCDANGANCVTLPGQTSINYTTTSLDAGLRLRVAVTGTNASGSTELPDSGATNTIIPDPAINTKAPSTVGDAYTGSTLVGLVGEWQSPKTTYERTWERCDADGTNCNAIINATDVSYVPQAQDRGSRIRLRVTADTNESYALPPATILYTDPTAVVTDPPAPGGAGGPGGGGGPGVGGGADTVPPALSKLSATATKLVVGKKPLKLHLTLSEPATLKLTVLKPGKGRRVGGKCVAQTRRNRQAKRCTRYTVVGNMTKTGVPAGARTISFNGKLGKRKLHPGSYVLVVQAFDATGNASAARRIAFRVALR